MNDIKDLSKGFDPSGFLKRVIKGEIPMDTEQYESKIKPNSTQISNVFLDVICYYLTDLELRVMLYVFRHTFGYDKKADAIAISQFIGGIKKKDGTWQDLGISIEGKTYQAKKARLLRTLRGLEESGFLLVVRDEDKLSTKRDTNLYRIDLDGIESLAKDILVNHRGTLKNQDNSGFSVGVDEPL